MSNTNRVSIDFELYNKLKEVYGLLLEISNMAPSEDICPSEVNEVFSDVENLKSSLGYVVDNLTEYARLSDPFVVIIERDYKGEYERFALTLDDYNIFASDIILQEPNTIGCSCTIRPMVHLWYQLTEIGSKEWNLFFSDMAWGLAESDIEKGNLATIREDATSISLLEYLPKKLNKTLDKQINEAAIENKSICIDKGSRSCELVK